MNSSNVLICPECGKSFSPQSERCSIDNSLLYSSELIARVGKVLDKYKIISILGKGGMGAVYRGEHILLKKPVAIKILHVQIANHEDAATRFLREARAASQIHHPNIVDVTDFGNTSDGVPYFVMELLEGENLNDALSRRTTIPLFETINIVYQIARALAAAHDHGILHLDLKPANIYLINREGRRRVVSRVKGGNGFVIEPEGQYDFVKVLDFGIARCIDDNFSPDQPRKIGSVLGTPHYMSPEQIQGLPVDVRSEIYSLGILFYKMLFGVVPFDSNSVEGIFISHLSGKVPQLQGRDAAVEINEETNRTILCCLEKDPNKRFQSMDAFSEALQNCFTDRAFMRDAWRLPGAIKSGIVPLTGRITGKWFNKLHQSRLRRKLMELFSVLHRPS